MKTITMATLKGMTTRQITESLPFTVTSDKAPIFTAGKDNEIIVLSDLHIRVQQQLKAQERKARVGMPPPEKVLAEELLKETSG